LSGCFQFLGKKIPGKFRPENQKTKKQKTHNFHNFHKMSKCVECGDNCKSAECGECEFVREENAKELTDVHERFVRDVCNANQMARMERNRMEVSEMSDEKRKEVNENQVAERERMRVYDAKLFGSTRHN
jgi:hypothetical protein